MDDCEDDNYNNGLVDSSSYIIINTNVDEKKHVKKAPIEISSHPLGKKIQGKKKDEIVFQVSRPVTAFLKKTVPVLKDQATEAKDVSPEKPPPEPFCHLRMDSIIKLKDSTRKLLCLLEEIQSKTYSKQTPPPDNTKSEVQAKTKRPSLENLPPVSDVSVAPALNKLESQAKTLNAIYVEDEDDDCSIFKRLTRKCNCLNQMEYNDFVIHFNEDTKYFTSTIGEIIKNMRILKRFLYMGGTYTKNALIFLNEGLGDSAFAEKVEITQGCAHSDMCNVFEEQSIVATCISWPGKIECFSETATQNLAAAFLHKLAQLEEGRRYLKFTSKITNDIKKVLRRKGSKLDMDTTESLNATLDLMNPPMAQHVNLTYYCRPIDEGYGDETIKALSQYREYMTLDEVFTHLDLLHNLSNEKKGKTDLTSLLPALLLLFKQMLMEYDNSEMNIIITNILNNIVSNNMIAKPEKLPKTMVYADMATEPIKMKHQLIQMPPKKVISKKQNNKAKSYSAVSTSKFRQASRRKVSEWETAITEPDKKFEK
ncbi:uncharacterized protein LOC113498023 isoform X2 [Trichoplusia ni]|uniref:Uncharacterized protein LOC113498023 isoform X2 n=2 Tax=Trichoplusia ni TaxID=7111 RepID=A0A7E5VZE8_TRINI|nr:uncharacterized protein LOC113498023 isoform X2 [Trichoplusia ni]